MSRNLVTHKATMTGGLVYKQCRVCSILTLRFGCFSLAPIHVVDAEEDWKVA